MELETLYKRTRTGAIQYWKISSGYFDPEANVPHDAFIEKQSGQLGTSNPIKHTEPISEGKNIGKSNETTPLQQAESQALSDWTRKKDEGYVTYADTMVSCTGGERWAYASTKDINTIKADLEHILPLFNTDANGQVLPQLAPTKPWKAGGKTKYPKLLETKFDGNRTTAPYDGELVTMLSRTGKPHTTLRHLSDIIWAGLADEEPLILDGEIYLHGLLLEEINEAIKKTNDNTPKLQFVIYDVASHPGTQLERKAEAKRLVEVINSPFITYSEHVIVNSDEEVLTAHDAVVEKGFEGAILKDPKGTYQPGQRSSFWTKVKMFEDDEFEVIGHKLGQRGAQDLLLVCKAPNGNPFEVTMNGSVASKEKMLMNINNVIGKQLTVKFFGYTKYGIPNIAKGKCIREPGS